MHLDPQTHLALHHDRTARALADPRRHLPRRARPPGRLRTAAAGLLRAAADALAAERAPEPRLRAARRHG
jgi:hypothetical protein